MKGLAIIIIFILLLVPVSFNSSDALRQVAGKIIVDIKPGGTDSFEWGLASDKTNAITTVKISAEGDGAEFLSFEKSYDIDPQKFLYIPVTVNVPADYPGDITLEPLLYATEFGEEGGATVINIRMLKVLTFNIAPNDDSSLWVDWEALKAQEEPEVMPEEPEVIQQQTEMKILLHLVPQKDK